MTETPLVLLDACVLATFSLCDALLRLAEPPRLYEPRWSEAIISETTRTLESKLGWPSSLTAYLQAELRAHFGEAWISGYEVLVPQMTNHEKDRHVLAAAVHGQATIIITFNLRHFRHEDLEPWGIRVCRHECRHGTLKRALRGSLEMSNSGGRLRTCRRGPPYENCRERRHGTIKSEIVMHHG